MSTDAAEILGLIDGGDFSSEDLTYQSVSYNTYLGDVNNGSYSTGQIMWNTDAMKDKFIVLGESYAAIPLSLTNAAYNASTRLALKGSIVSLINGSSVRTANGSNIYDETTGVSPIINELRLLTEEDIDFVENHGESIHFFGPDRNIQNNVLPGAVAPPNAPLNPYSLTKVNNAPATNDTRFNPALTNRVSILYCQSALSGTSINFIAYIPLKFIHPYFRAMCFPLCGNPLEITLNISGIYNSSTYTPIELPQQGAIPAGPTSLGGGPVGIITEVTGPANGLTVFTHTLPIATPAEYYLGMPCKLIKNNTATVDATLTGIDFGTTYYYRAVAAGTFRLYPTLADALAATNVLTAGANSAATCYLSPMESTAIVVAPAAPTITINPSNINDKDFNMGSCRLYLKQVTFRPKVAAAVSKKFQDGFEKIITFKMCDRPGLASYANSTLTEINTQISSSVVRPTDVWVMLPPRIGGATALSDPTNCFPNAIGNVNGSNHIYNANIVLNGNNYYLNTLQSQRDFYNLLQRKMPAEGALISYNDFRSGINPYYFDISSSQVVETNMACNLQLMCQVHSGGYGSNNLADKAAVSTNAIAYDLIVLIERLNTIKMNITTGSTVTSIAQGLPQ